MSLTLYYHPLSSYCHKTLIAMYELATPFDKRLIDFSREDDRAELAAVWPMNKFPVLRDHARQRDVPESSIIIEYVDQYYPGATRLIPHDREAALEVRQWDRILDNHVHTPMQGIVRHRLDGAQGAAEKEQAGVRKAYALLDAHLASRPWIAGAGFSMADCAAAPALFYASTVVPFPASSAHLSAYFERLMERPSVQRVIDEAKPYFHFFPFADAIPQRFR